MYEACEHVLHVGGGAVEPAAAVGHWDTVKVEVDEVW